MNSSQAGLRDGNNPVPTGPSPERLAAPDPLYFLEARALADALRSGTVSARELMEVQLQRVARLNPRLNALVAQLDHDRCLELAEAADEQRAQGRDLGILHGLPFAVKDTEPAVGFPFTLGSTVFRNQFPADDSVVVERIRRAGALIIGKTNVPEFGMGSHTYNRVYGTTVNPYDPTRSAGGSSGGAGAALAAGLVPLANGSDLGGSLRNPGNFNNVVGFRPSVGLVPNAPTSMPFGDLAVKGPLARTVSDAALLLSVMAGPDDRDPACYPSDPLIFRRPLERDVDGVRVAWCPDLGGLPLDPEIREVLEGPRSILERLGCVVEETAPDLSGADETFLTLRRWRTWSLLGPLLHLHRAELKPEAVDEIEAGARVTTAELTRALSCQAQIMERLRVFQKRFDVVACAVNQVPPFDARLDWPREIDGVRMEHYIGWMKSAYWISTTACPAISVPAGFTHSGLPVGIQFVGRYRRDFELMQFAFAFEQATQMGRCRPAMAVT